MLTLCDVLIYPVADTRGLFAQNPFQTTTIIIILAWHFLGPILLSVLMPLLLWLAACVVESVLRA